MFLVFQIFKKNYDFDLEIQSPFEILSLFISFKSDNLKIKKYVGPKRFLGYLINTACLLQGTHADCRINF